MTGPGTGPKGVLGSILIQSTLWFGSKTTKHSPSPSVTRCPCRPTLIHLRRRWVCLLTSPAHEKDPLHLGSHAVCANRFRLGRFKSEICIVNKCQSIYRVLKPPLTTKIIILPEALPNDQNKQEQGPPGPQAQARPGFFLG